MNEFSRFIDPLSKTIAVTVEKEGSKPFEIAAEAICLYNITTYEWR